MSERFIVFSDLHLHNWSYGASLSVGGHNSRLYEQYAAISSMAAWASENDIKYVFFCGDFFHTPGRLNVEVLTCGLEIMQMLTDVYSLETYWLVGNHDQASRSGNIHSLKIAEKYGNLIESAIDIPGFPPIAGMDYTENQTHLETFLKKVPDEALVFLHQGVSGVEINSKGFTLNEILRPDMIPDHITHAFAGHYHSYKRVTDKLTIPGAPMQHNWGDVGDRRGFLDVTLEGDKVHMRHLEMPITQFVKKSFNEIEEGIITPPLDAHFFLKIFDVPDYATASDLKKTLPQKYVGIQSLEIELKTSEKSVDRIGKHESPEDLFESFVKDRNIKGRELEVGKEIMQEKYNLPDEITQPESL